MITTTYTLKGDKGSMMTVSVTANPHNVATAADLYIHAVSDEAPDMFADELTRDSDLIIGRCFDGDLQDGGRWSLAFEDGELTHADMSDCPEYVETFTATVRSTAQ